MGFGFKWAVGELGSPVKILHKTTIGEMGICVMGMNHIMTVGDV